MKTANEFVKATGIKFNFSTSPRKGGLLLAVYKTPKTPEALEKLEALMEDLDTDENRGWQLWASRDGNTVGIAKMVAATTTPKATAMVVEEIAATTPEEAPTEEVATEVVAETATEEAFAEAV